MLMESLSIWRLARFLVASALGVCVVLALTGRSHAQTPGADARQARFDYLVRADFFAGLAGDQARMKQAMDLCERTLAENPKHAEALVWHGAGLLAQSGAAFQKGDFGRGGTLWDTGLKEMNDAVALEPNNVGVLIPRGASLLIASKNLKPELARPLIESAVQSYEHVLAIQTPILDTLGDHAKGELLFGLAEGYHRLGDHEKARHYFEQVIKDAPTSGQTAKAREWLATGKVPASGGAGCVGCHK
jgi:tetratricopeptide (TPR) repeat protein